MLPQLIKKKGETLKNSHNKLPSYSRQDQRDRQSQRQFDSRSNGKILSSKKVRTGGGFNKCTPQETAQKYEPNFAKNSNPLIYDNDKIAKQQKLKLSGNNLSSEIKMIQRKIKACQKKLEQDKRRQKLLAEEATREQPQYDFDNVVRRELELQGYYQPEQQAKNFDYLTNPGGKPIEEPEQQLQEPYVPIVIEQRPYDIDRGIQKLEKHYQNSLKRRFERRQMFPHQACKRKTPNLYISHKTNTVNKYGRALNDAEHMFRVYTKETTPQQIYPTIPNFAVVKDSLSKNIIAYLGDYKPFLDKTKQKKQDMQNTQNINNTEKNFSPNINLQQKGSTGEKNMSISGVH